MGERKILRRFYGLICEEAAWKSKYNEELYRLYDEIDLVTTIKITRLRWARHIARMQDNIPCQKITLDKLEGRRRAGRPNLRWMDGVMRDAERLGLRNWRIRARERDGWRCILELAKNLHGL
jgi:histone acetyltransferase (RNA polymerase elongator complex component)